MHACPGVAWQLPHSASGGAHRRPQGRDRLRQEERGDAALREARLGDLLKASVVGLVVGDRRLSASVFDDGRDVVEQRERG